MNIDTPLKSQIPALRNLWQEAFGDTKEFLDAFFTTAFRADHCRCVTADGRLIASLYWFDCLHMSKRVAYLYAVATSEAFRRQGICHGLIESTHQHLSQLGYEGTILVPGSEALFCLYESMGYQTCSQIQEFHCTCAKETFSLSCIDKTSYARLRRKLLPAGGVIQETENLDFLQTQAKFYAGHDFLLAACADGNTLCGIELLGNTFAAPKIVQALGYTEGIFRTPGEGVPFAMYRSLGESKLPAPAYFGLAFDL